MPTFEFTSPEGKTYSVDGPEGATREQAFGILQQQIASGTAPAAAEPSPTVQAGRTLNDVPRQLGLTARYALEGPAKMAEIVTEPIRRALIGLGEASRNAQKQAGGSLAPNGNTLSNLVAPPAVAQVMPKPLSEAVGDLATRAGLPEPQTPLERTVGAATKMGFGAMAGAGAAQKTADLLTTPAQAVIGRIAPQTLTLGQNTAQSLAANPVQQVTGAAGAGGAGEASKEAGGTPTQQAISAALGGVAGSLAPGGAETVVNSVRSAFAPKSTVGQLDIALSDLFKQQGIDYSAMPVRAKLALRSEMQRAQATGGTLDPAAAERLAAFSTVGATPTRGMLSQNPVQITNEQNLSKIAANTADGELAGLPAQLNANNRAMIGRLNDLGAGTNRQPIDAGRLISDRITGQRDALRGAEQSAWDAAKASPGYTQPISNAPLHAAARALDDQALTGFVPKQITDYMQAFTTGQQPFTPQHYKNLRSLLSAEVAKGGNEAAAARSAIRAIDDAGIQPIQLGAHLDSGGLPINAATAQSMRAADAAPGAAVDLVNQARAATRRAYAFEDSNPLVRSVLADSRSADPEKIAQSFVMNGTVNDARQVAEAIGPQGLQTIKEALATSIKRQALSRASDETGKVSQSALKSAIDRIGEEKLRIFFSPEEIQMLKATSRVASLQQAQPVGSAVNNSNSGALLLGRGLDALKGVAGKIPGGQTFVLDPARNISVALRTRQAQNVGPALLRDLGSGVPDKAPYLLPALAVTSGLLTTP